MFKNPIPTNKQHADPKRPPRPLDLTWSCRLTPFVQNRLDISWAMPNEPDQPQVSERSQLNHLCAACSRN